MGPGRRWERLRFAEPVPIVHPAPDPGCERGGPLVRGAFAVGLRGGRAPLPAGVPDGLAIGQHLTVDRTDAIAAPDPAADCDADAHPRADAGSNPGADAGSHPGADDGSDPGTVRAKCRPSRPVERRLRSRA